MGSCIEVLPSTGLPAQFGRRAVAGAVPGGGAFRSAVLRRPKRLGESGARLSFIFHLRLPFVVKTSLREDLLPGHVIFVAD